MFKAEKHFANASPHPKGRHPRQYHDWRKQRTLPVKGRPTNKNYQSNFCKKCHATPCIQHAALALTAMTTCLSFKYKRKLVLQMILGFCGKQRTPDFINNHGQCFFIVVEARALQRVPTLTV